MSGLVNAQGQPLSYKKASHIPEPRIDREFGQWAGRDTFYANLPGGGILQFDLSKLTLADFRSMRSHYQLGASLNVLMFMMHQIDMRVECESEEIASFIEQEIRHHWTSLIFGFGQSFWAGYSPMAVNYWNHDGYIRIKRIKDLVPEECSIEWKKETGWAPYGQAKPTMYSYNGIRQNGFWIPPENTLWYPLLMENGDFWGRKLLKPAFPAYFFSNLIHLYANRYFERFGEPLPIGRAPFEDDVMVSEGQYIKGKKAMEDIVQNIRNRATVVLPSDTEPDKDKYLYNIEYLESQMRGADFERYLSRLDEEMSLSVFTPVLLFRTADVGSYNLGQAHLKIFEQMLNTIAGDMAIYLQDYLVDRLRVLNFGQDSPRATWTYRRLGTSDLSTYKEIVVELIRQSAAKVDLVELGALIGVNLEAIEQLTADPADPNQNDQNPPTLVGGEKKPTKKPVVKARSVLAEAAARAAREHAKGNPGITLGFRNRFVQTMIEQDHFSQNEANAIANEVYGHVNAWIDDVTGAVTDSDRFRQLLEGRVDHVLAA